MSNQKSGLFISGLLLGSVIGTATGLLIAPRTGKKTRQLVKKSASAIPQLTTDLSTSLKFQTDRFDGNGESYRCWSGAMCWATGGLRIGASRWRRDRGW